MSGELGRLAMQRVARQADHAEQAVETAARTLLGPIEGRALRIGVDERDPLSLPGPLAGEMQRERRLADAAFLVEQRDDYRLLPSAVFHRSASRPTSEELDSSWLESKLGGSQVTEFRSENTASGS